MRLLIHHRASPVVRKVLLVLAALGLDVPVEEVDPGVARQGAYRDVNPNGTFPTLVDGDLVLWESNAVCVHLAETAGRLWPSDRVGRADGLRWLFWEAAQFGPATLGLTTRRAFRRGDSDPAEDARMEAGFHRWAAVLDRHLGDRTHVLGEFSIVDFCLAANLTYREAARLPVGDYPALMRWLEGIEASPAWTATRPSIG